LATAFITNYDAEKNRWARGKRFCRWDQKKLRRLSIERLGLAKK